MPSPSSIISLGLGSWGSPSDIITLGYGQASYTPTISVILTDGSNNPIPSLTGLSVDWWDQPLLINQVTVVQKWSAQTTDGTGKLSVTSLTLSALSLAQIGWIEVSNSTGAVGNGSLAGGPVQVS